MYPKILVIEDEPAIRSMLRWSLEQEFYTIIEAPTGKVAFTYLNKCIPDLILLDWMLPDMSGPKILKKLRKLSLTQEIPIIMLTARCSENDKVKGLRGGADDYVTKPFSVKELSARIATLLRRTQRLSNKHHITSGNIKIYLKTHKIKISNQQVHFAKKEYQLLTFFISHPNRVYTRSQLLDYIWGPTIYVDERTVDVHILRLRKQLKPYNLDKTILTVRGTGYRFSPAKKIKK